MSQKLLKRIEELEEENKRLKRMLNMNRSDKVGAYNEIRQMIRMKVEDENVPLDYNEISGEYYDWTKKCAERQIMRDLKWDLRVRVVTDFTQEHIQPAKEYIENYVLPEKYKKSRWN